MVYALYFIGYLCVIAGIVLGGIMWPEGSSFTYGYGIKNISYILSLTYFFSGLVSALFFFAFGKMLDTVLDLQEENRELKNDLNLLIENLIPLEKRPSEINEDNNAGETVSDDNSLDRHRKPLNTKRIIMAFVIVTIILFFIIQSMN